MSSGWKTNAALAVVSTALALVVIELVLRSVWQNPYAGESDHVLSLRKWPPGIRRVYDRKSIDPDATSVVFRTDDRSYVLPSFQYDEPDATVVFLGGSTTACVAVAEELRFPALVSTLLAEHGLEVNTLNAARSGNNLHDSLNVLLNHVVLDRPDFAVLMHAVNDHGTLAKAHDYSRSMGAPLSSSQLLHWLKQGISSHFSLAGLIRQRLAGMSFRSRDLAAGVVERNAPERARELPVERFRMRLRAFVALARSFGITPVLMTQPLSGHVSELTPDWADLSAQERFNEVIRDVAREREVPLIDLARYLIDDVPGWNEPMKVFYDGMHVTDEGSRIYAQYISEFLSSLIRNHL